jgi:hypothetical protein
MPVPIAVTHPKGAGLTAANPATLETAGPFARLAAAAAAAKEAAAAEQQQPQQPTSIQQAEPQQAVTGSQQGVCNGHSEQQYTVAVDHLDFSYPGLGATS